MSIKIAVIGGGSSYTPELAEGLIKNHGTFPVGELALVDIPQGAEKAEIICALLKRMFKKAELDVKVYFTLDRAKALEGADFVVSQFRVGGLDARISDEKLPIKYGIIGQETTGPGGFANALRTIPVALEICRDIERLCPDAWLINFTNPSGIVTEAINRHTNVKCIGLCNVPINMETAVSKFTGIDKARLRCQFAGLNHLSFIGKLFVDGKDLLAQKGALTVNIGSVVKNIEGPDVPPELIDALGFIPSPYLRYYYLEHDMFDEETKKYNESGKTRAGEVVDIESALFEKYRDENLAEKPKELEKRGGALYSEAAVSLMNSIWNDTGDIHVVNVRNRGAIEGLPDDAVVETSCVITKSGATPLIYGAMPKTIDGLVHQVKAYETLTIDAAVSGDMYTAVLALMNHPLVRDVNTAKALFEDIVMENAEYLGNFMGGTKE